MSAAAIAKLRELWEKLEFRRIKRVVARVPEDVLSIDVHLVTRTEDGLLLRGHTDYRVTSNRPDDIPPKDRWRARIAWRHFYGFTEDGIYFQGDDNCGLDCDIDLTMDFSRLGNHMDTFARPAVDALIAGVIQDTPKGKRFTKWFVCPPELKYLIGIVLNGTSLSENELAAKLLTNGYPDTYWAIARLALFDNVQAFVDLLKDLAPVHPCHGQEYGDPPLPGSKRFLVGWNGMWLANGTAEYVHLISYRLNEPGWWAGFQRLAAEQGLHHEHPAFGGWCEACEAEGDPLDRLGDYAYSDY